MTDDFSSLTCVSAQELPKRGRFPSSCARTYEYFQYTSVIRRFRQSFSNLIIYHTMKEFEIRDYGKQELGRLYCPETKTAKGALNNLKFWIRGNRDLTAALRTIGMPKCAQHYSAEEVKEIIYYLGEPAGA